MLIDKIALLYLRDGKILSFRSKRHILQSRRKREGTETDMQILARYSDIGRYSKVEAQAHYHQEGITMWITWYMAKFARESRYQEIEVEYYDFNWKKQRQKLSGWTVQIC